MLGRGPCRPNQTMLALTVRRHCCDTRVMSAEAGAPAASSALSSSVTSAPPSGAKSGTPSVRTIASVIDEASSGSRSTEVPAWDQWGNSGVPAVPEGSRITVENLRISDEGEEDGHAPAVADSEILDDYEQLLKNRTSHHVGYPYNLDFGHSDLLRFLKYSVNNLGDPWLSSNYKIHSRPFELAVLAFFARLWKIDDGDYWGYVTTCGTEGNLHGILTGREVLPDAVLYASCESHYSIMKAARFYRMDMVTVPTLYTGEIDYDKLQAALEANKVRRRRAGGVAPQLSSPPPPLRTSPPSSTSTSAPRSRAPWTTWTACCASCPPPGSPATGSTSTATAPCSPSCSPSSSSGRRCRSVSPSTRWPSPDTSFWAAPCPAAWSSPAASTWPSWPRTSST